MGNMIRMMMNDGAEINVWHAEPAGERRGGLVLVQEIFGITPHIREVADDFAARGFEVLAPALFDREEPGFEVGYDAPDFSRAVALAFHQHPYERSVADVGDCVAALASKGAVFCIGYCYGGSVAWSAAAEGFDGLKAVSSFYGSKVPTGGEVPQVPTIAHFGRFDEGIPIAGVEALAANPPELASVHVYNAGHGSNSDRRDSYHEASAKLAMERTLALFAANGG